MEKKGEGGIEEKRKPEESKEQVKVETRNEVDEKDYERGGWR